jgi:hypothetical protein
VLPPSAVFDQAHNKTVAFFGVDQHCWNFGLAKLNERFDPALSASEIIFEWICIGGASTHRYWSLQADLCDTLDDLLKVSLVSGSRVENPDLFNGDHL